MTYSRKENRYVYYETTDGIQFRRNVDTKWLQYLASASGLWIADPWTLADLPPDAEWQSRETCSVIAVVMPLWT